MSSKKADETTIVEETTTNCCDGCAKKCNGFKYFFYHVDVNPDDGTESSKYCMNGKENCQKICFALISIWVGFFLFFWALLTLVIKQGKTVLWSYLGVFGVFFIFVLYNVILEHQQRAKEEQEEENAAINVVAK